MIDYEPTFPEARALALAADPVALRHRLIDAVDVLTPALRARFRGARFDAAARTLTGDGCRLVWRVRERPDEAIGPNNQQTSTGFVALEEVEA